MDWLEVLRQLRAAQVEAFSDHDRVGGSVVAQATEDGYSIRIVGPIDWWFGVDALETADELMRIRPSAVNLYIDSPGGNLFDALALRSALDTLIGDGTTVVAQAGALVGSAAVPVFLSGQTRTAQAYSRFMVHNPRAVFIAAGTLAALTESFENFSGTLTQATGMYWDTIRTHVDDERVDAWMASNRDTWLTRAEALEVGLLAESSEDDPPNPEPEPTASVDPEIARNVRAHLMATLANYRRR